MMKTPIVSPRFPMLAAAAVLCAIAVFGVPNASAQIIRTTATGDGADTYADEANRGTVRGANDKVLIKQDSANRRLSYFRFDIGSLGTGLDSSDIESATFSLTTSDANSSLAGVTFQVWGLLTVGLDNWSGFALLSSGSPARPARSVHDRLWCEAIVAQPL